MGERIGGGGSLSFPPLRSTHNIPPNLGMKVMDIRCPSHTSKFTPSVFTFY
jgi:hypothetical protein